MFKNLLIALLVAMNLALGAALVATVSPFPAAQAAEEEPGNYMILPVRQGATNSYVIVLEARKRQMLLLETRNGALTARPAVDLKSFLD